MVITTFNGCTKRVEYVYLKTSCPTIEVLPVVDPIDVKVVDGSISGVYMDNVINGVKKLRSSETYYKNNIILYNNKFADKGSDNE